MLSLILASLALVGANDALPSLAEEVVRVDTSTSRTEEVERDSAVDSAVFLQELSENLKVGGLLRMSLDYSGDDVYQVSGEDVAGVRFEDAQLWLGADVEGFEVFFMGKSADANAFPPLTDGQIFPMELHDAWIRTEVAEGVNLYAGQYKCPLVGSGLVGYDSLIMIDRTRIGQLFSASGAYQPGVAVTYDNETFHGKVAVQNGADGIIDEVGVVVRGELKLNGGARQREGALGAPEDLAATVGLGYFTDGSQIGGDDFGSALAADAYLTMGAASLHAEVLDTDEELAMKALGNVNDDATPYSATLGYLFGESRWEGALRYQDMDDELDTALIGAGINYYQAGHQLKYQFNVSNFDNDVDDGTIFQFGVTLGLGSPNPGCATCRS